MDPIEDPAPQGPSAGAVSNGSFLTPGGGARAAAQPAWAFVFPAALQPTEASPARASQGPSETPWRVAGAFWWLAANLPQRTRPKPPGDSPYESGGASPDPGCPKPTSGNSQAAPRAARGCGERIGSGSCWHSPACLTPVSTRWIGEEQWGVLRREISKEALDALPALS